MKNLQKGSVGVWLTVVVVVIIIGFFVFYCWALLHSSPAHAKKLLIWTPELEKCFPHNMLDAVECFEKLRPPLYKSFEWQTEKSDFLDAWACRGAGRAFGRLKLVNGVYVHDYTPSCE